MSLISAVILSFDDVVAEAVMSTPSAPSPQAVTARMGTLASFICGSYVVRRAHCCARAMRVVWFALYGTRTRR
jgi:hypothetical protein